MPRKIILDCDPGHDDALALLVAYGNPAIDLVVSGHTHNAYLCDYSTLDPSRRFLVTSAGKYGTLLTDIDLTIVPHRGVIDRRARNVIVQGEGFQATLEEGRPLAELELLLVGHDQLSRSIGLATNPGLLHGMSDVIPSLCSR